MSSVKDKTLAPQGRLNLEIAEKRMGALLRVRDRFAKEKPFKGLTIGMALHVTKETGILAGLTAKWDLRKCGQLGAAMAAYVVENEGTLLDSLDLEKVWARAEATYGEALPPLDGSKAAKKPRKKA